MTDERKFEPRLGRARPVGNGTRKTYLQRVLREAAHAGAGPRSSSTFIGSRLARGFGAGRVLARRDRNLAFRSRRVVVKTRIVKLGGRGAKAAALHLRYIQRDGVTIEAAPGELYCDESDNTEGADFLRRSQGDRHQFRFIVSAEDAGEYQDLKRFIRKLMARMESDLGTRLDWVAVDHHNTGHPHTHIVLRGRDDLGQELVIARDYIASGMRERAAEIVTLDLGPHTDLEIASRFARQVEQERLTDLDRMLRRAAGPEGHVGIAANPSSVGPHWAGRLQKLQRLGLAEEIVPGLWALRQELETNLRAMGTRADIIKIMHRDLGEKAAARSLADFAIGEARGKAIVGQVVSRGLSDGRTGAHYLIVDGVDGRVHYAEVSENADDAVAAGAVVRLDARTPQVRQVDRTIEAVAHANGGVYSPDLHRLFDPQARPEFIEAHVRRLEAMRRVDRLAERHSDGSWTVPPNHAANGVAFDHARGGGVARMELLSPVPLERLNTAGAETWLDRELVADVPTPLADKGFGHEARRALAQRRSWLMAEGLARQDGRSIHYRSDLLTHLRTKELEVASSRVARTLGKPYTPTKEGRIEGVYKGPVQLVSGKFAVIEHSRDFTLVPWRPILEREVGKMVQGIIRADSISWKIGRAPGLSVS